MVRQIGSSEVEAVPGAGARLGGAAVGGVRDFFVGVGLLFRGLAMYLRSPGLMLVGLLPAVLTTALMVVGIGALVLYVGDLTTLMTPFASDWSPGLRDTARTVVAVAIVVAAVLAGLVMFVQLTLLIGQPFYEAISRRVDDRLGGVAGEINVSFWRSLPRTIVDSVALLVLTLVVEAPLFVAGLIPVVGETLVPVAAAVAGGWILAIELTAVAFDRRGIRLRERRRALRSRPAMTIGFGVATFICLLVPLGAIFFMPAAVAGATLLARHTVGASVKRAGAGA